MARLFTPSESKYYLMALDAGTGSIRAVIFDLEGNQIAVGQAEWRHLAVPDVPGSMEFDLNKNWQLACECMRQALHNAGIAPEYIAAVSACSMREGIVLYNNEGTPIWACANVDARAAREVSELKELHNNTFENEVYRATGQTLALMCQTFGLPSSVKYESDGGPGIARIMAFLMGSSEALKDRYDFMKFQVFQWLIGATDGHAKNFSVFIQAGGSYRLTPFYDIISAFPVLGGTGIHISDLKLAMGLNASKGKKTAIDKIYPRHFLATAKVLRFPEVQMHEILSDFARMIPAALDNVKTSLPTDFPENVVTAVESNVLRLHGRLSREYGSK